MQSFICNRRVFVLKYSLKLPLCKLNEYSFYKEELIMAYVITDACVSCGTCEGECPVGAISAGDGKYEIADRKSTRLNSSH